MKNDLTFNGYFDLLKDENKCQFKDLNPGDPFLYIISGMWFHMKIQERDSLNYNAIQVNYGWPIEMEQQQIVYRVDGEFKLNG